MRGNFFYKRLGESILFYRKKSKLSQEELAAVSDIDRTYLAQIESGRANPTIKVLNKLSRSLRVKLKKLFDGV